ncbi:MAG: hypothetical protein OXC72_03660, partial [Roseovarius sp.]|nr:hypothetical protein [Roseovarius sp.]
MQSEHESITIKLDRSDEIIDLEDFGAMFAGLGEQFELFLKRNHPHISGHARVGIREMNKGSIIAEIAATIVPNVINAIQASIILGEFVDRLKTRYDLLGDGKFVEHASKKDISSIIKSIQAVSKDN